MKLKRRFYDSSINFKKIPVGRIVLGLVIGLVSTFIIYSFFYVLRESFRVMSLGFNDYGFWSFQEKEFILTKKDRRFYNIFFSGLSLILGNSVAILFIFSRPNKIINSFDFRRKRVLNDQTFLNFNFIYWFTKIGLVFGVFSMCCMDFEFLPYFKPIAYLLLVVLYLETWKNLALIFKKKFKIRVLHFIVMICFMLGLSQIDIVNYESIDRAFQKNNPKIEFPESDFHHNDDYFFKVDLEIAFKLKLSETNNLEIYTPYREKIELGEVVNYILTEKASKREELTPFLCLRILSDENINVKYIKMLEAEAYSAGIYKVHYEVYNKNFYETYFENVTLERRQNKSILQFKNKTIKRDASRLISTSFRLLPPEQDYKSFDTIKVSIQNKLKFNDKLVSKETMINEFKTNIDSKTLFLYEINNTSTYQDYINVLSVHNKAVNKLKQKEQTVFRESRYDYTKAYYDEQLRLKRKYPVNIIEKIN